MNDRVRSCTMTSHLKNILALARMALNNTSLFRIEFAGLSAKLVQVLN